MRLVVATDPGTVEINYTWLPTWIGMNGSLMGRLGVQLSKKYAQQVVDDAMLQDAEQTLLDLLDKEFPSLKGLRAFLVGLSSVEFGS